MEALETCHTPRCSLYQIIAAVLNIFLVCLPATAQVPPDYSRTPVLFVHGSGLSSSTWVAMIENFISTGYPPEYLFAVDLIPNDGANERAAELFIAPAAESLLVRADRAAKQAGYIGSGLQRLDIIGHSMGAVSSRWYAAKLRPDRVRTWISLAGANHGTNTLCNFPSAGNNEMCPAFATDLVKNAIQLSLNGTPPAPIDETPYGIGVDRQGITPLLPDNSRRLLYYSIRIEPDFWIKPESSAIIDGAGGFPVFLPSGVPAIETSPGNYFFTGTEDHDNLPSLPELIRFVSALLSTSISINDVTITEGKTGTTNVVFTVVLSAASNQTVTVDYATANGTAIAGSDYVADSGTLTFAPGTTTQTVTVVVNADLLNEPNETFSVNLSNPVNSTIADNQGLGTIINTKVCIITILSYGRSYAIQGCDLIGTVIQSHPFAVKTIPLVPNNYGLSQNYPNPFSSGAISLAYGRGNPETVIEYQLPKADRVTLKIYTILGKEVRNLVEEERPAGFHQAKWDGTNDAGQKLNSGVYLYKIQAGDFAQVKKLVLVK